MLRAFLISMNTQDLLTYFRDELVAARQAKDMEKLSHFLMFFPTLADAAYAQQDGKVAGLLEDMECCARDSLGDVEWKGEIPTDEQIINATKTEFQ